MTARRIGQKTPIGYDTAHQVNLLSYTSSNRFTVPVGGGVVRIECNYRANAWVRVHIFTGANDLQVQFSQPASGNSGHMSQIAQVFEGQTLYGERNASVAYGGVWFVPYAF